MPTLSESQISYCSARGGVRHEFCLQESHGKLKFTTAQSCQTLGAYSGKRGPGVTCQPRLISLPLVIRREHQDLPVFLLPFCTSKHLSSRNPRSSGPKHVCATALMAQEAIWVWPRCMPSTVPADCWERGDLPILLGMCPQSAPIKCKMLNYSHSWVCIFYLALWVLFGSHQVIERKG